MIEGLHHAAYRCRDSEETRQFYEDFMELPLVHALAITETKTARAVNILHTFYAMEDGSCLAFFDVPDVPFAFVDQEDHDLHIALRVDEPTLLRMFEKGKAAGIETRGIADHGRFRSIYFRDPNGYVIELSAPQAGEDSATPSDARRTVDAWRAANSRV